MRDTKWIQPAVLTISLFGLSIAVASSWDSAMEYETTCISTGTSANVTVTTGRYISGYCDAAAFVGNASVALADGGPTCTNPDAGPSLCELREANKPFYIRLGDRDNKVACKSYSGTSNCHLFRARD